MEIFAADPSGRATVSQLTFDRPGSSCAPKAGVACGYTRPQPSPDGRWLVYWSTGEDRTGRSTLWLARADGSNARMVASAFAADWAPDSRRLAYSDKNGIHILTTSGADRVVNKRSPSQLRWSPDGGTLAFVDGGLVLLRDGHERVVYPVSVGAFAWAPDGRRIAYWEQSGLWIVSTASGRPRLVYRLKFNAWSDLAHAWSDFEVAFSRNGRLLAFTPNLTYERDTYGSVVSKTISLLDLRTFRVRPLRVAGHDIAWAPDGSSLLYVQGGKSLDGELISTGDVQSVTTGGRIRRVVSAAAAYGGQVDAAAWVTPAPGVRYRSPQPVDGVFAGGPVQELVADGDRVAVLTCGGVWAGSTTTGSLAPIARPPVCRASTPYETIYSLALAADRLVWVEKHGLMGWRWDAKQATLTSPPVVIGHATAAGGSPPPDGLGTAAGAGSLLVMSHWNMGDASGTWGVDRQTIVRVEPGGALTPLSTTPGPYTVLDVDASRIVVSGTNETRILDANGTILLSIPVPTLAAQLSGQDLVLAAGNQLRVYDATTGALRATWPLPAQPVGHHCSSQYGDPSCWKVSGSIRLTLEDLAHGLATYVYDGQIHLLRLADGADRTIGPGTLARFTDTGFAFPDGARIRLLPFERLPLH